MKINIMELLMDFPDFGHIDDHSDYFNSSDFNGHHDTSYDPSAHDFMDGLSDSPNLTEHTLLNDLADGSIDSTQPHLEGIIGNSIAENYFTNLGGNVQAEVHTDTGIVDLLIKPDQGLEVHKLHFENGTLIKETITETEPFSVEVKNYEKGSFSYLENNNHLATQLENGASIAQHSYLGVSADFLNLSPELQNSLVELANQHGDGVILLPFSNQDTETTLNDLLNQIYPRV